MNDTRRRRLEQKGWRFGSAEEFLGLTDEESRYVQLKLGLSDALRARREAKGLTQAQIAARLGSSQSRVAKMEAADPSVSIDLLIRAMFALGATQRDLARLLNTPTPSRAA